MSKFQLRDPDRLAPVHPGDVLWHDFIQPMGLTQTALAVGTGIPVSRIHAVIRGTRGVTADTALRLGRFFGVSAELWMGLQADHDLEVQRLALGQRLEVEVNPLNQAS
ncbi:MAG: HigA family addiction module antitoxin [Candidatus Sericytochromatia bacterium]|nr:HigA family addiction module antitoxin [Candidatus Sericytochromatia bacterium]